jgi:N-acetyl-anhydromuramyl-L-alanine amidase AmpD
MALIPFAEKKLIPPGSNDPKIKARIGILHVDAGNAADLFDFFKNRSGGIESHGHVRKDGHIYQYRDTAFQADANLDANDFAISFETQGFGDGEWTAEQLVSIKRLMLWARDVHGIPLRKVTTWNDPVGGWGYHTLFGAPSHWTPVAKTCPGAKRIKQFNEILVPWMKAQNAKEATVTENHVTRARDHLHRSIHQARLSIEELEAVSPRRVKVRAQIIKLKAARVALKSVLNNLPTA